MHDRNGTALRVGDTVMLEMVVTQISPTPDYCNVMAISTTGRKPDQTLETVCVNAAVLTLLRHNDAEKA